MTTAQYTQAIEEAYRQYCELYYNLNATREAQEAAFEKYQQLREESEQAR